MRSSFLCYRALTLMALAALLQACDPKSSSTSGPNGGPVSTNRITLDLSVESADLRTTVVRANLNNGGSTSYRLDGGDFLRACVANVCRNMADNDSVFSPDYIARFDYAAGIDHVVSFNRQDAQDAPNSRVVLPPAFTIVTPANRQQVTDGETVLVSWTPTGAPARVVLSYEAECSFVSGSDNFSSGTLSTDTNADGRESVRIDPIISFARSGRPSPPTRCSIGIAVRHELRGRVDAAFDDGTAVGAVLRKVNLDYIPR
jgi:hypothetical protein